MNHRQSVFVPLIFLTGAALAAPAIAAGGRHDRPTDDFGHEFVKVGRPGNRAALPEERYFNQRFPDLGKVDRRYRIATKEVTAGQWLEFVNAYWPIWEANGHSRANPTFIGDWISYTNPNQGQNPNYYVSIGAERRATNVSWEIAARYANWLHNGKVNEEWAFETGAYDTSTFAPHPEGGFTHQPERSPDARFWLPSVDEWVKAAHYDPDRYGEGQEGYWTQKGGQQTPLTPGLPENGGQTSAGDFLPSGQETFIPVGSYPDVQSPWGLLDTSGGAREWTETIRFFADDGDRHDGVHYIMGSDAGDGSYETHDLIDYYLNAGHLSTRAGVRLASMIPAPGIAAPLLGLSVAYSLRRQRR